MNLWMCGMLRFERFCQREVFFYGEESFLSQLFVQTKLIVKSSRSLQAFHSWIDRILRRQIANDLSSVLASLATGGENFDEIVNTV